MDFQGKTGCSTKNVVGCAYGPHSIYSYIFICTNFLLKRLVHQFRSAKLSPASAVRWESLSRGDSVWNCVMLQIQPLSYHSACKSSTIGESLRWSSTSVQRSTTDPRDLWGEDLIWWWVWRSPAAVVERRLKVRKRALDTQCLRTTLRKKFHGRKQCHRNKQGEWWEKGIGEQ